MNVGRFTMKHMGIKSFVLLMVSFMLACSSAGVKKLDDGRSVYSGGSLKEVSRDAVIEGHVYDRKTEKAVPGARVEIKNANMGIGYYLVETSGRGYYSIKDFIPHVQYIMEISAEGYVTYTSTGHINPGEQDIYLDPEAVLAGTITDSTGRPISGVEVKLQNSDYSDDGRENRPQFSTTGSDGKYRFIKLVQGSYSLAFSGSGYITETARLQRLKQGETFKLDMKMFRPASIAGTVMIKDLDVPAQNISVIATGRNNHSAVTYQDGTWRLDEMKPGTYELNVSHKGFYDLTKRKIVLNEGEEKKDVGFVVEAKRPEAQVYAYRYTFAPGNKLEFNLRTFRLESVTATVYRVPMAVFLKGKGEPDLMNPPAEGFAVVTKWEEPILNFEPFQWRYQNLSIKDPLASGGYCIEVKGAGKVISRKFFTVTSVGTVVKRSQNTVFVYATNLVDNGPEKDASVVIFDATEEIKAKKRAGQSFTAPQRIEDLPVSIVHQGKTNKDGIYRYGVKSGRYLSVLVISRDGSYAICNTGSPSTFQREKYKYFIYTDRPVYRSGDTVYYKIIGKERKELFIPIEGKNLFYKIINTDTDQAVRQGTIKLDEWGTAQGKITIEETFGLGTYEVRAGPTEKDLYASGIFYVEQYRKPEYAVEVTPSQEYFINGDELEFKVEAKYFFGAPVRGGLVRYRFYENKLNDADNQYWFDGESGDSGSYNRLRLDGEKYLDENGIASLKLFSGNFPYDREVTLEATVIDESNVSITSQKTIRVGRGEFYIKINPRQNFFASGDKKEVAIKTMTQTGKPISANVKVELYRYIWKPYQRVYVHESRPRFSERVTTNSKGEASIELPARFAESGEYDIITSSFDRRSNKIEASRIILVYNPSGGEVSSRFRNLELSVSDTVFEKPGEVTCLIKSRFSDAYVCVTLEGRDIYYSRVVKMTGNITPVTIPVREEYAPNFYINAVMQRKRALYTVSENISIPVKETTLKVSITPKKEVYLPGDTAEVTVKTTDEKGNPIRADLSLAAVDEAIYSIRYDHTPKMKDFFYTKISNWVLTSYSYPITLLAGAGKDGKVKVRQKFDDTAFWNGIIRTDEKGMALVSFKLPDNLTTWRLTARGHDRKGRVGEELKKFLVTQDLIARLGKPRFFIEGDAISLLGIVNSNTQRGLEHIKTEMKVNDATVRPDQDIKMSLPAFGSARNIYSITVPENKKELTVRFDALADKGAVDALQIAIPVERRGASYKLFGYGDMAENRKVVLVPVQKSDDFYFVPEKIILTVNPTPLIQMIKSSEYLVKYPYGCVEQTINSFMPVMALHRFLEKQSAAHLVAQKDVDTVNAKTHAGVKKLGQSQNDDGTWGWWAGDRGNAFLTGYALQSLFAAGKYGYAVDNSVTVRGLQSVKRILQDDEIEDDDARAYLLYTYALYGLWDARAYEKLSRLRNQNPYRLAFMVRALASRKGGLILDDSDKKKNEDVWNTDMAKFTGLLKSMAMRDGKGIYWESADAQRWGWQGGRVEITAHVLSALVAAGDSSPLPGQMVQSIAKRSRGEAWSSTKETATVIYSFVDFLEQSGSTAGEPLNVSFAMNGNRIADFRYDPSEKKPADSLVKIIPVNLPGDGGDIAIEVAGTAGKDAGYEVTAAGTLYFKPKGLLSAFRSEERSLGALSNGLVLHRSFSSLTRVKDLHYREYLVPGNLSDKKEIQVGDEILVKLRFQAQDNFEYLVLEDYLPSGFEVVKEYAYDEYRPFVRVERWDNRMVYFFNNVQKGAVYEVAFIVRAELPGSFMVRPTRMECMYEPSIQGWSAPMVIEVKGKNSK
ncbi:MAG: hypothetical protein CVV44_02655 [Spirochaetae bacterium HGW-Spirochaetae-1]|nr:MAG: hypothetical protein CVV44_02655 [Spirochaetae bacterium HGW-Spirochaetae-1]